MSKKNLVFIIIIIAILVLALGIFLLFFTAPQTQAPTNTKSSNSPFGNYTGSASTTPITPTSTTDNGSSTSVTSYLNTPTSPLVKISMTPIAGAEVFDRKLSGTTTTSVVRYIERGTGHTDEYDRTTSILSASSNTTIPSIYQAWWSGNTVLAQFLGQTNTTIKTFVGSLPVAPTSTSQLAGTFLTDNLTTLAISPKGTQIFTIPAGTPAVGSISNLDGSKKTTVLNFPFNEWTAQWPSAGTITLTTKASAGVPGYMYLLTTGGSMTKAIGDINGLATLTSPNLGYAIMSASTNGGLATAIYDLTKDTSLAFTSNPTLAEKCVWSKLSKTTAYCAIPSNVPIGNYPDDWYQGNISFVDNIYKVDLTLPAVQLLYKLPTDQAIDAINLFLDSKEENLYFTNKNDYYLWGLNIKGIVPVGL